MSGAGGRGLTAAEKRDDLRVMPVQLDHPEFVALLLLALPIYLQGRRSLKALDPMRRWLAVALRLAVLLLLVTILAGPQAQRWHKDLTVIAVVDRSDSVRRFARAPSAGVSASEPNAADPSESPESPAPPDAPDSTGVSDPRNGAGPDYERWLGQWIRASARDREEDDRLGFVTFDGRPVVRALPSKTLDLDPGVVDAPVSGTDTASAIRLAMAMFPPDSHKRLVVVADGNDTASPDGSDILAAAREAGAAGIPIDVLPVDYAIRDEVMVDGVFSPTEAREGQTVALRAVLRSTKPTEGLLFVRHDGETIDLNGDALGQGADVLTGQWTLEERTGQGQDATGSEQSARPAEAGQYVWVRKFDLPVALVGANRFQVLFEPSAGQDTIVANNVAESFTLVHGKGKVLFLDGVGPPSGAILPQVLEEHGIELDLKRDHEFPARLATLHRYDAVILQNVPAERLTSKQKKALATYVHDLGGGLVMVGGPDSFGAGGWTRSAVDQILPVACQIPSQTELPSGALVLVLDRSGSMGSPVSGSPYNKQEIANEAAVLAMSTLYPQDLIGVVGFDNSPKWIVKLRANSDPRAVARLVRQIQPGGGTAIYPALVEAYKALSRLSPQDAAVKHVILLTDGQSQEGAYYKIANKMVQAGITLSTVGVGDGVNGTLLAQLAEMAGGTYHPVSDPNNLPQVFIKEARTVRKNLVKEMVFTPSLAPSGSPIVSGLGSFPKLKGFVLTGKKARAFTPLVGPEGEPIFAHWQAGLGRSAAFTSDASNRWATPWLEWGGYSDFWSRTVRAVARPPVSRDYDLMTTIQGDRLQIRLDAASGPSDRGMRRRGQGASFVNFLNVFGTVLGPDGQVQTVTLNQTGPGVYETSLPAGQTGNYVVSLMVDQPGKGPGQRGQRRVVVGGASRAPGQELRRFRSQRAVLEQVAQITGGRVLDPGADQPASLFSRASIGQRRSVRPLWRPLLMVVLVLFLLDVAARRIAWDGPAIRRWFAQRLESMLHERKPAEAEVAATFEALKRRADQVDQRLSESREAGPQALDRERKFEASSTSASTNQDLASAVGGARGSAYDRSDQEGMTSEASDDDKLTTGRLLDAKRRVKKRLDDAHDSTGREPEA